MLTMRVGAAIGAVLVGLFAIVGSGVAQEKQTVEEQLVVPPQRVDDPRLPVAGKTATWTLESAVAALERFPDDAYLRYVAIQLARDAAPRPKALAVEKVRAILKASGLRRFDPLGLSGSRRAIQESLQLDELLPAVGIEWKELENPFAFMGGAIGAVAGAVEEKQMTPSPTRTRSRTRKRRRPHQGSRRSRHEESRLEEDARGQEARRLGTVAHGPGRRLVHRGALARQSASVARPGSRLDGLPVDADVR